ncbi:hypothetical protein F5I97DRAFT_1803637, partial [Phlebopus sp. FC_14]
KKNITISYTTLQRQLEDGRSYQQANEENHGWLTSEEEKSIVQYCLNLVAQCFPLNHK